MSRVTVNAQDGRRIGDALVFAVNQGGDWYGLAAFADGRRLASPPQESPRSAWRAAGELAASDQERRRVAARRGW